MSKAKWWAIGAAVLAASPAALGLLTFQDKDRLFPLLEELTGTARRIRGTTEFVSEEAVKPFLAVAGAYAKVRGTMRSVVSRGDGRS